MPHKVLDTVGLCFNIAGGLFVAVEAIKLENIRKLTRRLDSNWVTDTRASFRHNYGDGVFGAVILAGLLWVLLTLAGEGIAAGVVITRDTGWVASAILIIATPVASALLILAVWF